MVLRCSYTVKSRIARSAGDAPCRAVMDEHERWLPAPPSGWPGRDTVALALARTAFDGVPPAVNVPVLPS